MNSVLSAAYGDTIEWIGDTEQGDVSSRLGA